MWGTDCQRRPTHSTHLFSPESVPQPDTWTPGLLDPPALERVILLLGWHEFLPMGGPLGNVRLMPCGLWMP